MGQFCRSNGAQFRRGQNAHHRGLRVFRDHIVRDKFWIQNKPHRPIAQLCRPAYRRHQHVRLFFGTLGAHRRWIRRHGRGTNNARFAYIPDNGSGTVFMFVRV